MRIDSVSHDKIMKSIEMFGRYVIPHFKSPRNFMRPAEDVMADIRAMRDQARAMGIYRDGGRACRPTERSGSGVSQWGEIIEFITVNVATHDVEAALAMARDRPRQPGAGAYAGAARGNRRRDVAHGASGAVSVIAATGCFAGAAFSRPARRGGLLDRGARGNLAEVMREWAAAGVQWVLPEPYEFPPGNPAGRYLPERLKANG